MTDKMNAVVITGPGEYGLQKVDVPKAGYGEALIRVKAAAICGSDPKLFKGLYRPVQPPIYPFIAGHELAGEIIELGEGVKGLAVGDRVACEAHHGCGHCENCAVGLYNLCMNYGNAGEGHRHYGFLSQGGFAKYAVYNCKALTRLPDNVSFDEAALLDSSTTAFNAIRLVGITLGGISVIVGAGPVGLFAVQFAKAFGGRTIVLGRGARLEKAKELGADITVDITKEDGLEAVNRVTGNRRADQVFECAGTAETIAQSAFLVKRGGKVALIGIPVETEVMMPVKHILADQIEVIGSRASSTAFPAVLGMFSTGLIKAKPLISHTFSLTDFKEAMDTFCERRGRAIKVIVNP
ncbi:MAG: alcohol dehydrogenase catalytic domain-containing protein [Treponema sp.]|jgi:L-iditol 2-dehydrogenase|nr:alcohol dehydrogenase catalytic domain-containing protein [Treponema sp.]